MWEREDVENSMEEEGKSDSCPLCGGRRGENRTQVSGHGEECGRGEAENRSSGGSADHDKPFRQLHWQQCACRIWAGLVRGRAETDADV